MRSATMENEAPLVVHIVNRLDYGGLENGLVNLVNTIEPDVARHAIVAMTVTTDFARRVKRNDVEIYEIGKRPGQDPAAYRDLYRLIRRLQPTCVHTRNVGTLDCQLVAWLAGVPLRIHGEHGWDTGDPNGKSAKYRLIRLFWRRLVHRYVALSREIERYLVDTIAIPPSRVTRICNGVDTARFRPREPHASAQRHGFPDGSLVIGSVTRFQEIKDPLNTVQAFVLLKQSLGSAGERAKLLMVGDGPLRADAEALVQRSGLADDALFTGTEDDVAGLYRQMDVFVLGSRAEGISNTVLEAQASGLPVVATEVGGNAELVARNETGILVPASNSRALADALASYVDDPGLLSAHAAAARRRAVTHFSLDAMVAAYSALYAEAGALVGA